MTPVRVLAVASEVYPLVKTGGLADVAGALPAALKAHGVEMATLMPGYPDVMRLLSGAEEVRRWPDYFGGAGRLLAASHHGLDLFVLDVPHLYARPGDNLAPWGRAVNLAGCISHGDIAERIQRGLHAACPAREPLGGHAGHVDRFDFAREIVERETHEQCGRATKKAVHPGA